jgi:general secretion pathway protein G
MNGRMNGDKSNNRHRKAAAAFTLLEMMLVVAIIGILMSVAVWNIVGQSDKARIKATQASMRSIESAIKAYKADKGSFPPSLQTLVTEKYFEKVFKDAWKHDLVYATPGSGGKDYALVSGGPDGQTGTEDDIDVWRIDEDPPVGN